MKYRIPVMLGKTSKQSYALLVSYLKYKYNTTKIDYLLDQLFKQMLEEEKKMCASPTTWQNDYKNLEILEKKVVYFINDRYNIDEWTTNHKESIKIEKIKIDNIIKQVYNNIGINKVASVRKSILSKIGFKLHREGSHHYYIVHNTFIDNKEHIKKYQAQLDRFNTILNILKVKGKVTTDEFIQLVNQDRELVLMLNRSNKLEQTDNYVEYVQR